MTKSQKKATLLRGWCLRGLLFAYDTVVVNLSYFTAVLIRFSDADSYREQGAHYMYMFRSFAPWYTIVCLTLFVLFRLYNGVWRYAGLNDAKRIIISNICTCIFYVIGSLFIVGRMPITVYDVGAGIQLVLISMPRLALRYFLEILRRMIEGSRSEYKKPLMIIGICDNTGIIQKKLSKDRNGEYKPVCVVDYAYGYRGNSYNGLPVFCGPNAIAECIDSFNIQCVIFADQNLPEEYHETIRSICDSNNIEVNNFVIGTDPDMEGIRLQDLALVLGKSKCIIQAGTDSHSFDDIKSALSYFRTDCIVDSISVKDSTICIHINSVDSDNI